ncbi:hypothetical protein HG531_004740 [Fusarium graminearum]|nr:hypothetical protein HG531_004740 [Fusarium graminearum]
MAPNRVVQVEKALTILVVVGKFALRTSHPPELDIDMFMSIFFGLGLFLFSEGPSNNQRNVDVFFIATLFARLQTMLADMETVVGGIDDISMVQNTSIFQLLEDIVNQLINCLEST